MRRFNFFQIIFIILFGATFSNAQTIYGKIYTASEANNLYGNVISSKKFQTQEFKNLISNVDSNIMLRFQSENLFILTSNEKILYGDLSKLDASPKYKVYSKVKILELIEKGGSSETTVELRSEKITITNGSYTLEYGGDCPPFCG